MGIVGIPPTPESLFMFNLMIFMLGICDFLMPTQYIGVVIIFIIGVGYTLHYLLYWNRKPKTMIFTVRDSDGTRLPDEPFVYDKPSPIKNLVIGIGLILASLTTYMYPFLRLTSLPFLALGLTNLYFYIDFYLHKA